MRWLARVGGVLLLLVAAAAAWLFVPGSIGIPGDTSVVSGAATSTAPGSPTTSSDQEPIPSPPTTVAVRPVVVRGEPLPPSAAPEPSVDPDFAGYGVAVVAEGGADLSGAIDGASFVRAQEGLTLPVMAAYGEWVQVMTPCDDLAWSRRGELSIDAHRAAPDPGSGFDFSQAVIVVDAGHGGENNIGAVGRQGTQEKAVNQLIALRVRDLLQESHVIDWDTGRVFTGTEIPAVAKVLLTRPDGVTEGGDFEAGLIFRATLANAAGADAMVSIHNNAGHEIDLDGPGSDVFYQSQSEESRRLGAIMAEEFQRSFAEFDAAWVGSADVGAKSRLSPRDGVSQYYGILRRAEPPAVIAEGSYLSNPSEEALLATPRFQQAYAEAVYRALVRFLTTDDFSPGSIDPVIWAGFAGSGAPAAECLVPAQPD